MKKFFVMAIAIVALMASCTTSDKALNDLRDLSTQINTEGQTYGVKEWRQAAYKYYKVDKKILKYSQKGEYTDAEMEEIGELQGSCVSGFTRGVGQNVTDKAKNAASAIKGLVKGLSDGFSK